VEVRHLCPRPAIIWRASPGRAMCASSKTPAAGSRSWHPSQAVSIDDLPAELRERHHRHNRRGWLAYGAETVDRAEAGTRRKQTYWRSSTRSSNASCCRQRWHTPGGRKQEAALKLGWGRNTLTRKLKELGLEDRLPGMEG